MIDVDRSVAVNRNLEPGDPILAAPDIWTGLVMKAEDPVPFVKPISSNAPVPRASDCTAIGSRFRSEGGHRLSDDDPPRGRKMVVGMAC
jgi:hypothetical protein